MSELDTLNQIGELGEADRVISVLAAEHEGLGT